jgi:branched-subunit amino acid permease
MLVKTTVKFRTANDAKDSLVGSARVEGFIAGYVTNDPLTEQSFATTIFQSQQGDVQRGQSSLELVIIRGQLSGWSLTFEA